MCPAFGLADFQMHVCVGVHGVRNMCALCALRALCVCVCGLCVCVRARELCNCNRSADKAGPKAAELRDQASCRSGG